MKESYCLDINADENINSTQVIDRVKKCLIDDPLFDYHAKIKNRIYSIKTKSVSIIDNYLQFIIKNGIVDSKLIKTIEVIREDLVNFKFDLSLNNIDLKFNYEKEITAQTTYELEVSVFKVLDQLCSQLVSIKMLRVMKSFKQISAYQDDYRKCCNKIKFLSDFEKDHIRKIFLLNDDSSDERVRIEDILSKNSDKIKFKKKRLFQLVYELKELFHDLQLSDVSENNLEMLDFLNFQEFFYSKKVVLINVELLKSLENRKKYKALLAIVFSVLVIVFTYFSYHFIDFELTKSRYTNNVFFLKYYTEADIKKISKIQTFDDLRSLITEIKYNVDLVSLKADILKIFRETSPLEMQYDKERDEVLFTLKQGIDLEVREEIGENVNLSLGKNVTSENAFNFYEKVEKLILSNKCKFDEGVTIEVEVIFPLGESMKITSFIDLSPFKEALVVNGICSQ